MKRARISSLASDTAALTLDETTSSKKYTALDRQAETPAIRCSLPPHEPRDFTDAASYEAHYLSSHTHRCSECHRNFPSERYLELHIAELHDPIAAARRDAGQKTYMCFVEGCEKVCIDWKKRRSHLVDKHSFPRNYDFFVVQDGIDGRRSLLRRGVDSDGHRKSSRERQSQDTAVSDDSASQVSSSAAGSKGRTHHMPRGSENSVEPPRQAQEDDTAMDAIASSFDSLRMVPRSVTFGRRKGKAGFSKS